MHFRYDINALRAIAVISVVIFHFYPQILTGGFAGVDVFFVISGFLMTGIIMRGFEKENFNLIQFYIARCNRIIPALAVLCFVLIILGWFILLPTEYKDLGKHVASSITFISNMIYWRESGYFDTSSLTKWLLHTWSLSVEWQFYMLYPIYLMILKKIFNIKLLPIVIYTTFILSLTIGIYLTSKAPSFAYFSLFGRAWELLLGGCVYFIAQNKTYKNNLFYLGITLIIASSFFIDSSMQWPGYLALIPTLGAALVLLSNNQNSYLVQNSLVQKLGLYSYSIYLWHWPIVVFLHYFNLTEYSILGIIFSIFLGYLSYTYIESQKFKKLSSYKQLFKLPSLYMLSIIFFTGSIIFITHGMFERFPEQVKLAAKEKNNRNPYHCMQQENNKPCILGNSDNIGAILIGDSHADAITTALLEQQEKRHKGILVYTKASCPFILNALIRGSEDACLYSNKERLDHLQSSPDVPIILAARWPAYIYQQNAKKRLHENTVTPALSFYDSKTTSNNNTENLLKDFEDHLDLTIKSIKMTHENIYIVMPIPEMLVDIPESYVENKVKNTDTPLSIATEEYDLRAKNIRKIIQKISDQNKIHILDPINYLCDEQLCYGTINDRPIYYDSDHLSEYGNKFLVPMFEQIVQTQPESSNHSDQGYESHE